jgi:hypothetical protein
MRRTAANHRHIGHVRGTDPSAPQKPIDGQGLAYAIIVIQYLMIGSSLLIRVDSFPIGISRNSVAACRFVDTPECNRSAHKNPRGGNPNCERYGEKPVRAICVADEENTSRVALQMLLECRRMR